MRVSPSLGGEGRGSRESGVTIYALCAAQVQLGLGAQVNPSERNWSYIHPTSGAASWRYVSHLGRC